MEYYFLKVVPSPSELSPNKAIEEAFEHKASKSDGDSKEAKFIHCYKVVGEQAVVAVIQAPSADAADKFVSAFTQDTPLIGQGRLLSSTCWQLINYKDLVFDNDPATPTKSPTKEPAKDSTVAKEPAKDATDSTSITSTESKDSASSTSTKEEPELPFFWVEAVLENGPGAGNASMFSQFVTNDVKEAVKKYETHGATVSGYKVVGEKKFQYFVSGITSEVFEDILESMPIMSMPNSTLSCRRVKLIKAK